MSEERFVDQFETVEEIDEAISALRERRKEMKAAEREAERERRKALKARQLAEAKERIENLQLEEGATIRAFLKGEEVEVNFVKLTDARLVIEVDGLKKALPFDKFVSAE